jgi:CRP/FNR family transcriptional regulator
LNDSTDKEEILMEHRCVALVPLFSHLKAEEQDRVESLVHRRQFRKGETVYAPGAEPVLIIVATGKLKVYQLSESGREQLLRLVGPGEYVGQNALFGAVNGNVYVDALEDTLTCTLRRSDFTNLLLEDPRLAIRILEINARIAADLENQSRFLLMEDVGTRLATYFLDLCRSGGADSFTVSMKWKELAAYLGTTAETLSRKLKALETEGIIRRKGRHVDILDKKGLEDRAS